MGIELIRSIILVGAGKGGVGKSSITCLLAHAFVQLGLQVGILDADLYGPSIPKMLGYNPLKESLIVNEKGQPIPLILQNISTISLGLFQNERPAIVRAPVANSFIDQMLLGTDWGPLDILLVDLPPGTSDIHLTILQKIKATCSIVVTTPQVISYQDAKKAAQMFFSMSVPIAGVIENLSGIVTDGQISPLFHGDAAETIQKEFNIEILTKIPLDPNLSKTLDQGINPLLQEGMIPEIICHLAEELRDWMWLTKPHHSNEETLCTWN